jgi:hypothetical protein
MTLKKRVVNLVWKFIGVYSFYDVYKSMRTVDPLLIHSDRRRSTQALGCRLAFFEARH